MLSQDPMAPSSYPTQQQQLSSPLLRNFPHLPPAYLPLGMDAMYSCLLKIYPTQRNPMQISTSKKYWLGGTDPLDYVNVYFNAGDRNHCAPPHWHYVSMGLTDLHGDGRVHRFKGQNQPSGLGFELTFRLKREPGDGPKPPLWPAAMMQHLAKYAFYSAKLSVGDFVKWATPLDGVNESRIEHILLVTDAQLNSPITTACGVMEFLQIVGICEEERRAVQKWNAFGVSQLLRKYPATGGSWLITDLRRGESVFEIDPSAVDLVDMGVASDGSNLTGIQAWCWWTEWDDYDHQQQQQQQQDPIAAAVYSDEGTSSSNLNYVPYDGYATAGGGQHGGGECPADNVCRLPAVHIRLNAEAATYLPLALKGRLAHGRHFTFKSHQNGYGDVTFLPPGVSGSFSTIDEPYAYRGTWLHVQVWPELQSLMIRDLNFLESVGGDSSTTTAAIRGEPNTFQWPEYKLKITVLPDVQPGF